MRSRKKVIEDILGLLILGVALGGGFVAFDYVSAQEGMRIAALVIGGMLAVFAAITVVYVCVLCKEYLFDRRRNHSTRHKK